MVDLLIRFHNGNIAVVLYIKPLLNHFAYNLFLLAIHEFVFNMPYFSPNKKFFKLKNFPKWGIDILTLLCYYNDVLYPNGYKNG